MLISDNKKARPAKKDSSYAWASFGLALFFWVPIFNIILFLPASLYLGIVAIRKARKDPLSYGGMPISILAVVFAAISFVYSLAIFIYTSTGRITL